MKRKKYTTTGLVQVDTFKMCMNVDIQNSIIYINIYLNGTLRLCLTGSSFFFKQTTNLSINK